MTVRAVFKRPPPARPVSRAGRLLALAHHVERLVESGEVESYAVAARALGLTRARMSQILRLTGLAPGVQEQILIGEVWITDHALRAVVGATEWMRQYVSLGTGRLIRRDSAPLSGPESRIP